MNLFDNANRVRFLIAPNYITNQEILIILTDIGFWNVHFDELQSWCQANNGVREGMTVTLPDHKTLTMFCLKWQ